MLKKVLNIIIIFIMLLSISSYSKAIKSMSDVASEFGMTEEELEEAIDQGMTYEDLQKLKNKNSTKAEDIINNINNAGQDMEIASEGETVAQYGVMMGVFIIIGLIIYLIPTIVACVRKHPYKVGIILIDIFLGWSLIGWVGALVWACILPSNNKTNNNKYKDLENLQKLKDNGAITNAEFEIEKQKLLR